MEWGSISLFAGFLEKENSLGTLIVIFENVSPKGFFWLNMKNFEISIWRQVLDIYRHGKRSIQTSVILWQLPQKLLYGTVSLWISLNLELAPVPYATLKWPTWRMDVLHEAIFKATSHS